MCDPDEIQHEVLGYLARHPEAEDTLAGIAGWWVLERCVERRTGEVRRAVAELVERGLLVRRRAAGTEARYRLSGDRAAEIDLLRTRRAGPPPGREDGEPT